ncbi:MAG: hypothetical protein WEB88_15045 [Gemmatimonadota bacterium]
MGRRRLTVLLGLTLAAATATEPAAAQFGRAGQTRAMNRMDVRGGVAAALLRGDAGRFLDNGYGPDASVRLRVDRRERLSLRGDAAWIPLGEHRDEASGRRGANRLLVAGGGPDLALRVGWFEPYLRLFGGMVRNHMEVTLADGTGATDTDTALAWGGGAGVRVFLAGTRWPVSLDVSGLLVDGGELLFAHAPGTTPMPGGGLQNQLLADVGMVLLSAGLSVGLF